MAMYQFGSGVLVGKKTGVTNPTPREFGILQDFAVDMTSTTKPLHGQYQLPVAVGRGTMKLTGKARFARIYGALMAELFFGVSLDATKQTIQVTDEANLVPATPGPYTVTVTNASGGISDLGVKDPNGLYLERAAATPSATQYSVVESTGVYTFNAALQAKTVQISYTYNKTSSNGPSFTVSNPLLGTVVVFELHFKQIQNAKNQYFKFNQCIASKLAMASKLEDWTLPEMDVEMFADGANNVWSWSGDE